MPKSLQTFNFTKWCDMPRLEVHVAHHTAHWKVNDDGHAHADFTLYGKDGTAPCLSIDTSEYTDGAKSMKRTMLTLDEKSTAALYELLRARIVAAGGTP
jgi:hypothetical protein